MKSLILNNFKERLNLELAIFILTPRTCSTCKKVIIDQEELIAMYSQGECLSCDHVRGEQYGQ